LGRNNTLTVVVIERPDFKQNLGQNMLKVLLYILEKAGKIAVVLEAPTPVYLRSWGLCP